MERHRGIERDTERERKEAGRERERERGFNMMRNKKVFSN